MRYRRMTSTPPINCAVCLKRSSKSKENDLESQLSVIYFLQRFFGPLPLTHDLELVEAATGLITVEPIDGCPAGEGVLQQLLIKHGNPSKWLTFCPTCTEWVKEARKLFSVISKLQKKLDNLRSKVQNTIVSSRIDDEEEEGPSLTTSVRSAIMKRDLQNCKVDSAALVQVKMEMPWEDENEDSIIMGEIPDDDPDFLIFPGLVHSKTEEEDEESTNETWGNDNDFSQQDSDSDQEYIPSKSEKSRVTSWSKRRTSESVTIATFPSTFSQKTPVEQRTCPESDCKLVFDKPSKMKKHYSTRHGQKFEDAFPDVKPMERKSKVEDRTCDKCCMVFDRPSLLKRHLTSRHGYKFEETNPTPTSKIVKQHVLKSSIEDRTCPNAQCKAVFDKPSLMKRHFSSHHGQNYEEAYPDSKPTTMKSKVEDRTCPECQRVFEKPSKLKLHYSTHHQKKIKPKKEDKFKCNVCDRTFRTEFAMASHQLNCPKQDGLNDLRENDSGQEYEPSSDSDSEDEYRPNPSHSKMSSSNKSKNDLTKTPVEERKCKECGLIFEKISRMKRHIYVYHQKKLIFEERLSDELACSTCSLTFQTLPLKELHVCSEKNSDWHSEDEDCDSCGDEDTNNQDDDESNSRTENRRESKYRRKSAVKFRTCPICFKIFDRPSLLKRHLKSKTSCMENTLDVEIIIKCLVCNETLHEKELFHKHFLKHISDGLLWTPKSLASDRTCQHSSCNGIVFKTPSKLRHHLQIKHREGLEKPFECLHFDCGKVFALKEYLKDHEWVHLNREEKLARLKDKSKESIDSRTCPVCFELCITPSKMKVHLNDKHEKIITDTCEICHKGFTRHDRYTEHVKCHLNPEQRERVLAGESVTVQLPEKGESNIKVVEVLPQDINSTNRKTVTLKLKTLPSFSPSHRQCSICHKIFSNVSRMNHHKKTVHEKSKSVMCEHCGLTMTCDGTLRRHMQMKHQINPLEEDAKGYSCSECNQHFKHKYSHRRHVQLKHNANTDMRKFPCGQCSKAYPYKSLLNQHQKANKHFPGGSRKPRNARKEDEESTSSSSNEQQHFGNSQPQIQYSQSQNNLSNFSGYFY